MNFDGYYVQNTFDELNRTEARKYTFGSNKSVFETMDYNRVGNRTDGKVMSHSFGGSYEFNYEYDQNGNITRISDDSGNLRNEYTYDELGRLTSEINIPTGSQSSKAVVGEKIEYLYSKDGNIYQRNFYKVQALQGKTYVDAKANRSDSFGYSNTEWSDQLSSARINGKGFNFTYDKIGNPLSYRDGMVMTWQNGRQLKSIKVDDTTTLEFTYDINGQRQSKVEKKNGTSVHTTKYYYDGTKLVGENKDGTIVWYDYDENGTPIGMRLSGDDYVFRRNLQGDITGIFDSTGTLVVEYTYGNSWGFGITVSGSKADEIGACNSLRYRGYYYDSESGLYYLNTRYYDPSICRFVNADGYVSTGQGTQGYNMYSYCGFNPVNMVDPTGNSWKAVEDFFSSAWNFGKKVAKGIIGSFQIEVGVGIGLGVGTSIGPFDIKAAAYQDSITIGLKNTETYTCIKGETGLYAGATKKGRFGFSSSYEHRFETNLERDTDEHTTLSSPWEIFNCPKTLKDNFQFSIPIVKSVEGDFSDEIFMGLNIQTHLGIGGHFTMGWDLNEFLKIVME